MIGHIYSKYNLHPEYLAIPNVTRLDLAELFNDLQYKLGVEVGVADGAYSLSIMDANPQMKLYGIDPFRPLRGYQDYTKKETFADMKEKAHEKLDKYPNYIFVEKLSMEAVSDFADGSLDMVYIDGNHRSPFVDDDIREWTKKVRPGGIVSGHDFTRGQRSKDDKPDGAWDVKDAVLGYIRENNKKLFVWGLDARIDGLKRERHRSWSFFV